MRCILGRLFDLMFYCFGLHCIESKREGTCSGIEFSCQVNEEIGIGVEFGLVWMYKEECVLSIGFRDRVDY